MLQSVELRNYGPLSLQWNTLIIINLIPRKEWHWQVVLPQALYAIRSLEEYRVGTNSTLNEF